MIELRLGLSSRRTAAWLSDFFSLPTSVPSLTCQSPLLATHGLARRAPSKFSSVTTLPGLASVGVSVLPFSARQRLADNAKARLAYETSLVIFICEWFL